MPEEDAEVSLNNKGKRFCSEEDKISTLLAIFIGFVFNSLLISIVLCNAYLEQEQDDHHQLPPRKLHINHPTIVAKIAEFHNDLESLEPVRCSTCVERFPSISFNNMDYCKCHNDSHVPEQFSANNMDPGSVSPELEVSCVK